MGIKLVTRICLGLSHLHKHKFKHNFQDILNPLPNYGVEVKSSAIFLLQCLFYINERRTLVIKLNRISSKLSPTSCNFWRTRSFLGVCLLVTKRIHIFLIPLFTTSDLLNDLMNHVLCTAFFFHLYLWQIYHDVQL